MKPSAFSIAIVIVTVGLAGAATAGEPAQVLQTAIVSGATITECPPPGDARNDACGALNALVRANFSRREIGILFGTGAPVSGNGNVGFDRLHRRYLAVVQRYVTRRNAMVQATPGK